MADTVDLSNIKEYTETGDALERKLDELAELVRAADGRVVLYTGAGLSTAASIPDFRGPQGAWTRRAQGRPAPASISLEAAVPTFAHRAMEQLLRAGIVSYIVSQNIDGLHRRSGVRADEISELHGNAFRETCWNCGADHVRDFDVCGHRTRIDCGECLTRVPKLCHCTARKCDGCGSKLKDSIVHFGEDLPRDALERAVEQTRRAKLVIAFGTSLTVSPACELPRESMARGGTMVVVNLQKTPYDEESSPRLFAKCDDVMQGLATRLGVDVPDVDLAKYGLAVVEDTDDHGAGTTGGAGKVTDPVLRVIEVGNSHRLVEAVGHRDNIHEWTVFVRAGAEESRHAASTAIARVHFQLHPTFHPPKVTVEGPGPFEVTRVGWGTFPVTVTIEFKDGRTPISHKHNLSFDEPESFDAVDVDAATDPATVGGAGEAA